MSWCLAAFPCNITAASSRLGRFSRFRADRCNQQNYQLPLQQISWLEKHLKNNLFGLVAVLRNEAEEFDFLSCLNHWESGVPQMKSAELCHWKGWLDISISEIKMCKVFHNVRVFILKWLRWKQWPHWLAGFNTMTHWSSLKTISSLSQSLLIPPHPLESSRRRKGGKKKSDTSLKYFTPFP